MFRTSVLARPAPSAVSLAPAQGTLPGSGRHLPYASRFPIAQVSNAMPSPDVVAHPGIGMSSAAPPSLGKATFHQLADARDWSLETQSNDGLKALRQQVLAAAGPDGKPLAMTPDEQRCLLAGLNLTLLQRPGIWNESSGDLQSVIVNTPGWPADRALRIVDADNDAIHLYRPGRPEQAHRNNDPELPPPQENEIILLRHRQHFSLIRCDQDNVVHDVPADGDCFFSCISIALEADDRATSNLQLRRQLAEHIWSTPELLHIAGAYEGPVPVISATPKRDPHVSIVLPPPEEMAPPPVAPPTDSPALTAGILQAITGMYHGEMKRFLAEDCYAPGVLLSIHQTLRDSLVEDARGLMANPQAHHLAQLRRTMDQAYLGYQQSNRQDLMTRQKNISREQHKAMSSYMEQIEGVLTQLTTLKALRKEHQRICDVVEQGLVDAIHSRIRAGEPIEGHLEVLDTEIEEYWRESVTPRATEELARRAAAKPPASDPPSKGPGPI